MSASNMVRQQASKGVALVALLLILPALLVTGAVIKIVSGGPVLVREVRHCPCGTPVHLWVFCTRINGNAGGAQLWVGDFLQRTSLDELPGLINVLQGSVMIHELHLYSR
ncbi:hypothetical protein GPD67_003669 [Salmonella enterica]|nr:hypothetical protein [Salmonella enterica]EFS4370627.1 hypothetical protein [Salmonella enterica]EHU0461806.1 sugar transferase [Salmonella enterica]EIL0605932.1 sugar transferase [Salmonella enterica]ELP9051059.1 sugar transferase [Salmonella enterica]